MWRWLEETKKKKNEKKGKPPKGMPHWCKINRVYKYSLNFQRKIQYVALTFLSPEMNSEAEIQMRTYGCARVWYCSSRIDCCCFFRWHTSMQKYFKKEFLAIFMALFSIRSHTFSKNRTYSSSKYLMEGKKIIREYEIENFDRKRKRKFHKNMWNIHVCYRKTHVFSANRFCFVFAAEIFFTLNFSICKTIFASFTSFILFLGDENMPRGGRRKFNQNVLSTLLFLRLWILY